MTIPALTNPLEAAKTLQSLKDWALSLTSAEEPIPLAKAAMVAVALSAAKRQIQPTTPEILAVELRKLADWAKAFSVPASDLKTAAQAYSEALGHLPSDLIAEAFRSIKAVHKWGMRLPLPSEILATVQDRMAERRLLLAKLEIAKLCPTESHTKPPPTEAEKQRVDEIMSQWRSSRDSTANAH